LEIGIGRLQHETLDSVDKVEKLPSMNFNRDGIHFHGDKEKIKRQSECFWDIQINALATSIFVKDDKKTD
jgi:hypothetical protein